MSNRGVRLVDPTLKVPEGVKKWKPNFGGRKKDFVCGALYTSYIQVFRQYINELYGKSELGSNMGVEVLELYLE